jgi:hypothetical protein
MDFATGPDYKLSQSKVKIYSHADTSLDLAKETHSTSTNVLLNMAVVQEKKAKQHSDGNASNFHFDQASSSPSTNPKGKHLTVWDFCSKIHNASAMVNFT